MVNEKFVSKNENDEIVKNTFIIFGYVLVSIMVVVSLIWSYNYNNNLYLFVVIYSIIIILYTVVIVSLVVINKEKYDNITYRLLFSSTIFTIFLTFIIGVFFIYKFFSVPSLKNKEEIINYSYKYGNDRRY
jgi:chromate transport protein ChrA